MNSTYGYLFAHSRDRFITSDSKLASAKKRSLLVVNEHFERQHNAEDVLCSGLLDMLVLKKIIFYVLIENLYP